MKFGRWYHGAVALVAFAFVAWAIADKDWLLVGVGFVMFVLEIKALQNVPSWRSRPPTPPMRDDTVEIILSKGYEPVETPGEAKRYDPEDGHA